jgi:hypothetical protein
MGAVRTSTDEECSDSSVIHPAGGVALVEQPFFRGDGLGGDAPEQGDGAVVGRASLVKHGIDVVPKLRLLWVCCGARVPWSCGTGHVLGCALQTCGIHPVCCRGAGVSSDMRHSTCFLEVAM